MKATVDHEEIKSWAMKHGGKPQFINDPEAKGDKTGIRIDFPGQRDDLYEPNPPKDEQYISWDDFFNEFERQELKLEYEETVNLTDPSLSYRFAKRKQTDEASPITPQDIA